MSWLELASYWHEIQVSGSGTGSSTNGQVLFNSSGSVAGDAGLTYDAATDTLTTGTVVSTGAAANTFAGPVSVGNLSTGNPNLYTAGNPAHGIWLVHSASRATLFVYNSALQAAIGVYGNKAVTVPSIGYFGFTDSATSPLANIDTFLSRGGAAATIQLGAANSATPVAQRLKVQDGVGTNIAAAATVIHDGPYGTGTGAVGEFVIRTGAVQASGTTAHVPTKRLGIKELHVNLRLGDVNIYANNAAALAGGLVAGDLYRTGADPDPVMIVH